MQVTTKTGPKPLQFEPFSDRENVNLRMIIRFGPEFKLGWVPSHGDAALPHCSIRIRKLVFQAKNATVSRPWPEWWKEVRKQQKKGPRHNCVELSWRSNDWFRFLASERRGVSVA